MAYQDEIFIPIRMVNKNVIVIIASLKFIELFMDNRIQVRIIDIIIILDAVSYTHLTLPTKRIV